MKKAPTLPAVRQAKSGPNLEKGNSGAVGLHDLELDQVCQISRGDENVTSRSPSLSGVLRNAADRDVHDLQVLVGLGDKHLGQLQGSVDVGTVSDAVHDRERAPIRGEGESPDGGENVLRARLVGEGRLGLGHDCLLLLKSNSALIISYIASMSIVKGDVLIYMKLIKTT